MAAKMVNEVLTLRELVTSVPLDEVVPYLWPRCGGVGQRLLTEEALRELYAGVMHDLASLPSTPGFLKAIHVRSADDGNRDEGGDSREVVGMGGEDSTEYGLDYADWAELIDLPVHYDASLTREEALAHVLWEITFYGFSREEVNQALKALIESLEEEESEAGPDVLSDEEAAKLLGLGRS